MPDKQQIQSVNKASRLERFTLDFEYNKTLQEVKRETRIRTLAQN